MDEPNRKKRRMNMGAASVNESDYEPETDVGKIENAAAPESSIDNPGNVEIPDTVQIADFSTSDFKIIRTKLTFVDKSEDIILFFKYPSVLHITAPRRFGKTTIMNMLKTFLEITVDEDAKPISNPADSDNYKLFMDLKIGKNHQGFVKEHCGQYPVILLSLKNVKGETKQAVLDSMKDVISEAFNKHSYLLEKTTDGSWIFKNSKLVGIETFLNYWHPDRLKELSENDVLKSLKFLSRILYTHFKKKVVILIDETDTPIMKSITNNVNDETLRYLIEIISCLLSEGLKDNEFLERALLNSCVRLSGVFSWELNNQYYALFLQENIFSKTYGFTENEVNSLLEKKEFEIANDIDGVKKWYDGYTVLHDDEKRIYSSWSVLNYLFKSVGNQQKMLDSYWSKGGYVNILEKLFVKPEIHEVVNKLVRDENITIKVAEPSVDNILELKNVIFASQNVRLNVSQVNFFLQLLWDDGLLNAVEKNGDAVKLRIPNFEIKKEIERNCFTQSLFETKYRLKAVNIKRYIQALKQLLLITDNEEDSEIEDSEVEDSEEGATQKCKEAMSNLVNAISLLFSDGATIPVNESELHHILFYLAYNNTAFSTQSHRPIVKVSDEMRDNTKCKKLPQRKAKVAHHSKSKEKRGRKNECDMCVIFGTVAVIFELKIVDEGQENSKAALEQIIDRKYFKLLEKEEYKHIQTQVYVGICFKKNLNVTAHFLINSTKVNEANYCESIPADTTHV